MDILKILKSFNLETEQAEEIEQAIKKDIHTSFIPKSQYNKKVQELDTLKMEGDDLKARLEQPNEFESKYNDTLKSLEALQSEYDGYKEEISKKETRNIINSKVTKLLNDEGYRNEKVVELLLNNLDYDNIKVNNEGLEGFEVGTFTKGYEDLKTVSNIDGNKAPTPPQVDTTDIDPWLMGYN